MGKAWSWNKQTFKRTVLDSVLDKVVRDLFGADNRPQKPRPIGGARPPRKPQRQNFTLEAIEPRLLLSAGHVRRWGKSNCLRHRCFRGRGCADPRQ